MISPDFELVTASCCRAPQAAEMILGFGVADNGTSQTV
jgi:hypothetical protein